MAHCVALLFCLFVGLFVRFFSVSVDFVRLMCVCLFVCFRIFCLFCLYCFCSFFRLLDGSCVCVFVCLSFCLLAFRFGRCGVSLSCFLFFVLLGCRFVALCYVV